MMEKIEISGRGFYLRPLEAEDIEEALALCDQCVGKNLYHREELAQAVGSEKRQFLLLRTGEGELAGYIYYYVTTTAEIAADARLAAGKVSRVCKGGASAAVGKLQSVGVKEAFRRQGLAAWMMKYALAQFAEMGVEEVFIICWNAGGRVPLAKALQKCRFTHLSSAKMVWYDKKDLFCPYCKGRCKCDAEVYFKKVSSGSADNIQERIRK